jgi:uncharacterized protein (DUF2235 family)
MGFKTTLILAAIFALSACQSTKVATSTDSEVSIPDSAPAQPSALSEPPLAPPRDTVGKTIIVLMDGTWNEPDDLDDGGYPQQDSTNVEKLRHLLSGQDQTVLYFPGVGTDGKQAVRVVDGAFGQSAERRVDEAYDAVAAAFQPGDQLAIFGFSRGAATSRILARKIHAQGIAGQQPDIRFMGLFDTVAALGVPRPKLDEFRKQFHDASDRLRIPPEVRHVVHLVAIDEDRALFDTTLLSLESPATTTADETWFAGNHGDVGGGWPKASPDERQLAAITLSYMIREAAANGIVFEDWQSKVLLPENGGGAVHSKSGATSILGGDVTRYLQSAQSAKPRVHRSVKAKFDNDPTYRPPQLEGGFRAVELVD